MPSENKYEEGTIKEEIMDPCVLKDHNYFNADVTRKHENLNEGMTEETNAMKCNFCFVQTVDLLNHIKYNHLEAPENQCNNNSPSTVTNENAMVNNINQADDKSKIPLNAKLKKGHYRKCFVPDCRSTSTRYPNKIFLCVPSVVEKREQWFKAVNREYINTYSPSAKFFCCEDHFDLENDAKNWLKYKIMGPRPLLIKDGVLPRFFVNKPTERGTDNQAMTQRSLLNNITNKELDIESVDLYQKSKNSIISVSDLLTLPDEKFKFHIKNKESDRSDDIDWCINDKECYNEQKERLHDDTDPNESKAMEEENENGLEEEINTKICTENQEILCDNNNQSKESKDKSDLSLQMDGNDLLEPIKEMLYCNDCPSSFSTEEDMSQHIRVWHGTTNRRKPPSTTTNDSLNELQNLINVGTKDVNLMIESDVFKKFDNFQRENAINSNTADLEATPKSNQLLSVSKQRHYCSICNRDYAYNHFKSHLKEVHSETEYFCTTCGSNFKCERYLRRHIMYKHQNKTRRHVKNECQCPECPKTFKNGDCLSHHIRNCHGDKVECEICHSKLKSISYLKSHMRRVHYNDGKKHRCRICCKEFKSPRQVKIHMINLHPEALHPCPHCIRLFCSTVQLKIHLKKCQSTEPDINVEEHSKTNVSEDAKICDDEVLVID